MRNMSTTNFLKANDIFIKKQITNVLLGVGVLYFVFYFYVPEIILLLMLWLVAFNKMVPLWILDYQKAFISTWHFFSKRGSFFYFYRSCIKYYKQNPLDEQHNFQLPVRPTAVKNLYQR